MPSIPRTVRIKAEVTEPTMTNNVWTLAQFVWDGCVGVARLDIEERGDMIEWMMFCAETYNDLRTQFDMWLDPLPAVTRWDRHFTIEQAQQFETDAIVIRARASGWFELSDDPERMNKLLEQVSCERLNMQPIYFRFPDDPPPQDTLSPATIMRAHEILNDIVARRLLEPGTADNNINPNFHLIQTPPSPNNWFDERLNPVSFDIRRSRDDVHPGLAPMPGSQRVLRDMLDQAVRAMPPPPAVVVTPPPPRTLSVPAHVGPVTIRVGPREVYRDAMRDAIVYGQGINYIEWSEPLDSRWSADHNPAASTAAEETQMSDQSQNQTPPSTDPTSPPEAATVGQTQGGGAGQPPETYGSQPAEQAPQHDVGTPPESVETTPEPQVAATPETPSEPAA